MSQKRCEQKREIIKLVMELVCGGASWRDFGASYKTADR